MMAKETADEPTTTFPARTRAVADQFRKDVVIVVVIVIVAAVLVLVVTTAEVRVTTMTTALGSNVERLGGRRERLVGARCERMVGTGTIARGSSYRMRMNEKHKEEQVCAACCLLVGTFLPADPCDCAVVAATRNTLERPMPRISPSARTRTEIPTQLILCWMHLHRTQSHRCCYHHHRCCYRCCY
jgi:hypothetical protein